MTKQQIPVLVARLVEHQAAFGSLPTDDTQWAIQNTKQAIALFIEAIKKNRPKPTESILEPFGTIVIKPTTKPFVARDHFVMNIGRKAKVKIAYLDDNFENEFLDKTEEPFGGSELRYGKLRKLSKDAWIIDELGGKNKAETTLTEIWGALLKQPNGKKGDLFVNGDVNIFYIRNARGVLRAVKAYWHGDGWRLYVNSVRDPCGWLAGILVFSRNSVSQSL